VGEWDCSERRLGTRPTRRRAERPCAAVLAMAFAMTSVGCGSDQSGGDSGVDGVTGDLGAAVDSRTNDDIGVSPDGSVIDVSLPRDTGSMDAIALDSTPSDAPTTDRPTSSDTIAPGDGGAGTIAATARWHIDLEAPVNTAVDADVFDIDLFDNATTVIAAIHARGHRVICYFSAGSSEDWRPDFSMFPTAGLGMPLSGWPGERWLDIRNAGIRTVMQGRMDRARRNGCDGVDPDNVDGFSNATGFPLTATDQLDYNRFLAREAHARGLLVGLKNDLDQVAALVGDFDFAINESCFQFSECARLDPFTRASKSVLQIEYGDIPTLQRSVCPMAATRRFFSILPGADRLNGSYTRCVDGMMVM